MVSGLQVIPHIFSMRFKSGFSAAHSVTFASLSCLISEWPKRGFAAACGVFENLLIFFTLHDFFQPPKQKKASRHDIPVSLWRKMFFGSYMLFSFSKRRQHLSDFRVLLSSHRPNDMLPSVFFKLHTAYLSMVCRCHVEFVL